MLELLGLDSSAGSSTGITYTCVLRAASLHIRWVVGGHASCSCSDWCCHMRMQRSHGDTADANTHDGASVHVSPQEPDSSLRLSSPEPLSKIWSLVCSARSSRGDACQEGCAGQESRGPDQVQGGLLRAGALPLMNASRSNIQRISCQHVLPQTVWRQPASLGASTATNVSVCLQFSLRMGQPSALISQSCHQDLAHVPIVMQDITVKCW